MAVKKVVRMGHPTLRQEAAKFTTEEIFLPQTRELIQDLVDTMIEEGGIGIAAPQIGVSKQVAIIDVAENNPRYPDANKSERYIIFNPKITVLDETPQSFWEGCLSVPGLRGLVSRPRKVAIDYLDEDALEQQIIAEGFLATVFQHELDHLFGKLYVDHIQDMKNLSYTEEYEEFILPLQS